MLLWTCLLVVGAFGTVFTFANYLSFGIGFVFVTLFLIAYSERQRRADKRARRRIAPASAISAADWTRQTGASSASTQVQLRAAPTARMKRPPTDSAGD